MRNNAKPGEAEVMYRSLVERLPAVAYLRSLKQKAWFYVSPRIEALTGYSSAEWTNNPGLWLSRVHHDDRERIVSAADAAGPNGEGNPCSTEYRLVRRDGRVVWVQDEMVAVRDERGRYIGIQGLMLDITDRRRAEEELRLLSAITLEVGRSVDVDTAWEVVLRRVCEAAEWDCGGVWVPDSEGRCLESVPVWYGEAEPLVEFRKITEKLTFRRGEGLPGRAWKSRETVWMRNVSVEVDCPLSPFAMEAGIRAGMAVPIASGGDIVAVMVFFVFEVREENGRLLQLVSAIAGQLGSLIERKCIENALKESEERYALAAMGANDGLWDWKLAANHMYFSHRWKEMLEYGDDEIAATPEEWFRLVHPDDVAHLRAQIKAHLDGQDPTLESEYRMRCRDGSWRWMLCRGKVLRDESGKPSRMAGSQSDITPRKEIEAQLAHDAMHDPLTGLANRMLFMDRLSHAMERAQRHPDYLVGVMYLDIDNLKMINDSRGHEAGDLLLKRVARALESCLRPEDTLARMGGDEFAILLDDIRSMDGATYVAERLLGSLKAPVKPDSSFTGDVFASASIGIVMSRGGQERPEHILRDADIAMYRAKTAGGARYEMFDQAMRTRIMERQQLESELRLALERGEFRVYYQPIVSARSEGFSEVEALLRWQHPRRGMLPPSEFMQAAEETGLIVPIGEWVIGAVCAQSRRWQNAGLPRPRVMVNVSARQFQGHYLPTLIRGILTDTGVSPDTLGVEITESLAMQDTDFTIAALAELDDMGIGVSLDDFGTGYSSLACLKRFPIEAVKIDQSFLRDIPDSADDMAITSAIVAMAHSMNIRAIAEGVESEEQLAFLKQQQCDGMQGFLFNRPVSAATMTGLLARPH